MRKQIIKSFKNKQNTYLNISLGMYIAILFLVTLGSILDFGNLNPYIFDPDNAGVYQLKFFTVLSNLLTGILAIVTIIFIALKKQRKINVIHKSIYILNLLATTCVALTMFVTLTFLVPLTSIVHEETYTVDVLLTGANLIFHVLNPLACIIAYICFFKTGEIKFKETLYSLIPVVAYSIFYMCMALTHIDPETGKPLPWYDWYKFCSFGWAAVPFILIGMYGFTFLFSWLLWLGNRKLQPNRLVFEFIGVAIVIAMGIAATIWGFIDYGPGPADFCKWFTNLSNWLMIVGFVVYLVFLSLKTNKKIKDIPQGIYVFQLTGIVAAAITLFGVLLFLLPMSSSREQAWGMFAKYNLFFHLLLPLFGMGSFLLLEHNPKIKFRYLWICIVPMDAYLIFYFSMYLTQGIDWYHIVEILGKAWPLSFVAMAGFQFLLGWVLWLGNRNIHPGLPKPKPYFKWHKK